MIPFSDEELIKPVKICLEKIMPMLENDGGGAELLGIRDGKVYLRLIGACQGCPSSNQTIKYGIERELKIEIHPEIEVVNVQESEEF